MKIVNESKIVSEEAVKELEKKLQEPAAHEVLKDIQLRNGELDIRQLPDAEMKQVLYRFMNDTITLLNYVANSLNALEIIALESLSQNKKDKIKKILDGKNEKLD